MIALVSFPFQVLGLTELALFFRLVTRAAMDFGEAWVGSAVEYGPMNEFGTQFMEERPHWRVAIPAIVAELGGNQAAQDQVLDAMLGFGEGFDPSGSDLASIEAGGNAPLHVALLIERKVKQVMTSLGIIDTGNYRASVATGRTEEEAFAKSAARAFVAEDF